MIRPQVLRYSDLEAKAIDLHRRAVMALGRKWIEQRGYRFRDVFSSVIQPITRITIEENCDLGDDPTTGLGTYGSFNPSTLTVRIDARIAEGSGDPRREFTLWHEAAGHGWLQAQWIKAQADWAVAHGATEFAITPADARTLEWQANVFAGLAAVPTPLMEASLFHALRLKHPIVYVGPRDYWLDDRGIRRRVYVRSFDHLCLRLADIVKHRFVGLSPTVIAIRISKSRWVVQKSSEVARVRSLQIADCDMPDLLQGRQN